MPPEGVNATAILDYDPLAEGEVALTKGAKVLILEQEKGGWVKPRTYRICGKPYKTQNPTFPHALNLLQVDNNGTIGIIPATHVKADVPAEPAQGSSLTVAPAPASTPRAVKALYDYTAKETPSGGLSFKAGDVIEITSRDVNVEGDDQEWWSGTCLRTGESGKFPSMFVEAKANTGQTGIARAVYDYDESCPGELSFRRGDLIEVLDTTISTDWWEGRNTKTGRTGQFPTAYVEDPSAAALASNPTEPSRRASSEALAPAATATPVAVVTAAYDYEAQAEEELSFRRGDAINVISKTVPGDDSGGWWLGEKGGSVGEIPASYVEQEV
ncbi:MAG: SH3 domain-containing protein [Olpidium bornovanus]|uniref:SH3 domain-containing protein n=1 Tax=Olpidium bornovanus TaxID=278681 RepID=A0A8H8DHC7_9FUNG|nr:MAG: SH3 domain-containing protein [Olpidium bornovanus]